MGNLGLGLAGGRCQPALVLVDFALGLVMSQYRDIDAYRNAGLSYIDGPVLANRTLVDNWPSVGLTTADYSTVISQSLASAGRVS